MENKILDLFLYNNKLKFSEIEKALKVRSNKLSYHLKQLTKKNVLVKKKDFYELSDTSEVLIPYLSDKKAVLPVVLVHVGDEKSAFLYEREKKPFKGFLSLPGGRLLIGESIKQAAQRIMKEKFNVSIVFKGVSCVCLEHVKSRGKFVHSFLLILVSAKAGNLRFRDVVKSKSGIIPSDYELIRRSLSSGVKVKSFVSRV